MSEERSERKLRYNLSRVIVEIKMKLALLIGIDYIGTEAQLYGCINDVTNVKTLLVDHYEYDPVNITTLTERNGDRLPTRDNILTELYELILKSHQEEVTHIFISYSGHGSKTRDISGDEADGYDETIVPLDFKLIKDDHLFHIIQLLQRNCECFCLIDSCHSGSVLDLGCQFTPKVPELEEEVNDVTVTQFGEYVGDLVCDDHQRESIMISGCMDSQYSQECWVGQSQGAMTTVFVYLLQVYEYDISYEKLVYEMNAMLKLYSFSQIPVLSSNVKVDLSRKIKF